MFVRDLEPLYPYYPNGGGGQGEASVQLTVNDSWKLVQSSIPTYLFQGFFQFNEYSLL